MKKETLLFLAEATFFALIIYNISDYLFLRKFVTDLVSRILVRIGVNAPSYFLGGELMLGDYLFSKNCVAMSILSVVFGLLLASRGRAGEILLAVFVVFSVVSILNIVRLIVTYFLLSRDISFFWGHDVIANSSAVLLAFVIFFLTDPIFPDFKRQIFEVLEDIEKEGRGIFARIKASFK